MSWIRSRSETPILAADQPWEQGALLTAVALLADPGDPDNLRLYYLASHRDQPADNVLCLATSQDGHVWHKPDLGAGDNIVMRATGHETGWGVFMPCRILYEPGESNAGWHWKMVYWERLQAAGPTGVCLAVSADGLRWQPLHDRPIITNANDAMSFVGTSASEDAPLGVANWLLYQQTWKYNADLPIERDNLKRMHRRISVWRGPTTFDGSWVGPVTVLEPDDEDPADLQHYWLVPFGADGGFAGLLLCHHTVDQTMDVQRVSSPDGWTWTREDDRQPLIPLGPKGRFDCGLVTTKAPPCRWQGRLLLPYNGRPTCHDALPRYADAEPLPPGIGMIELQPDLWETLA